MIAISITASWFCFSVGFYGFPGGSDGKNPFAMWDLGWIPGLGRSPGGGNGNPLQYSCLENPMDRGVWWATVHGIAKNQTWWVTKHTHTHRFLCIDYDANSSFKICVYLNINNKTHSIYFYMSIKFLIYLHILRYTVIHISI